MPGPAKPRRHPWTNVQSAANQLRIALEKAVVYDGEPLPQEWIECGRETLHATQRLCAQARRHLQEYEPATMQCAPTPEAAS